MDQVTFTSVLGVSYRDTLDRLLFHNEHQPRVMPGLVAIIERYGIPRIVADKGRLRISLGTSLFPQGLYALDEEGTLVGVVVYLRQQDRLLLLHVAIREDFTLQANLGTDALLLRIVRELQAIGRRVKGIEKLTLFPDTPRAIDLSIRGGP